MLSDRVLNRARLGRQMLLETLPAGDLPAIEVEGCRLLDLVVAAAQVRDVRMMAPL